MASLTKQFSAVLMGSVSHFIIINPHWVIQCNTGAMLAESGPLFILLKIINHFVINGPIRQQLSFATFLIRFM